MKALVKKEKKQGLWLENLPIPEMMDGEVLIKTEKTSMCGTDLHIYNWDAWAQKVIHVPMITGHEFMGKIAKVGKNVKNLNEGDRVSGEGHITCGQCPLCSEGKRHLCPQTLGLGVNRPGCFAEYFTLPAENVFKLPNSISDDRASILDPYGNAAHTALSFPLTGEDILITGAGPVGIIAAAIAMKAGARKVVITDTSPYRLSLARKMGVVHTVNIKQESLPEAMKKADVLFGFTVGFEMSGNPQALSTLLETAQNGAHIALLGILPNCAIDWDLVVFKMLNIKGIYGREIFRTWHQTSHLLESGLDLTPIITHQFPAEEYQQGFDLMSSGNCGKIILNW